MFLPRGLASDFFPQCWTARKGALRKGAEMKASGNYPVSEVKFQPSKPPHVTRLREWANAEREERRQNTKLIDFQNITFIASHPQGCFVTFLTRRKIALNCIKKQNQI